MSRNKTMFFASILMLAPLAGCATTTEDGDGDGDGTPPPGAHEAIMAKARSLAPSLDTPEKALAAGYVPGADCVPGMGVHWLNPALFDDKIDEDKPEVVLFLPNDSNVSDTRGDRFLGIEYVGVTQGNQYNETGATHELHGQSFVGPMPGHFPGMPWHAELHVFLAEGGQSTAEFAQTSAAAVCPDGTTPGDVAILAAARAAAVSIDTPEEAAAAGYVQALDCVPGMGAHWLNPGLFDATIDETKPEVVLFNPGATPWDTSDDVFLGVEYVGVTQDTQYNTTDTVHTMHGRKLVGPMPGHFPGMPWHAELHVFIGGDDLIRDGVFAQGHSRVVCDYMAPPTATAALRSVTAAGIDPPIRGYANVTEGQRGKVMIEVSVAGLTPGSHGIHVHTNGNCDPAAVPPGTDPVGAGGAGGHFNPDGKAHGEHAGDLGNIVVGDDGRGHAMVMGNLTLEPGAAYSIAGRSFIVHAAADDGQTDPSGNSGPRVLCGVFA